MGAEVEGGEVEVGSWGDWGESTLLLCGLLKLLKNERMDNGRFFENILTWNQDKVISKSQSGPKTNWDCVRMPNSKIYYCEFSKIVEGTDVPRSIGQYPFPP